MTMKTMIKGKTGRKNVMRKIEVKRRKNGRIGGRKQREEDGKEQIAEERDRERNRLREGWIGNSA